MMSIFPSVWNHCRLNELKQRLSAKGGWRGARLFSPAGLVGIFLSLLGCLAIFNATWYLEHPFEFVGRQMIWLLVALLGLLVTSRLTAATWHRLLPYLVVVAGCLLWLVLSCGVRINGMEGWFAWQGIFLQPSELSKPVFVLSLAWMAERTQVWRRDFIRGFLPFCAVFAFWIAPVILEPDFGAVLVYGVTFVAVLWAVGVLTRHLLIFGLAMMPAIWAICLWQPYVWHRFIGFISPEQYAGTYGWHILQFQRTLASGGFLGQSWGKGIWSRAFLPLGYSDSIFATLAEAVGFLGVLPLLLLIAIWFFYGMHRAQAAPDAFRRTAILGMVFLLTAQSLIHLSVNLGLLPPTGITLPLISYGGSSLLASMIIIGVVEGLGREPVA